MKRYRRTRSSRFGTLLVEGEMRRFLPGDRLTSPKAQKEATARDGSLERDKCVVACRSARQWDALLTPRRALALPLNG